jgi:aspartate/glutamate racemase
MPVPRIALIHALAASMPPIEAEFERHWPQAQRMNLLDDSLSADLARSGRLDAAMHARFHALADYAVAQGAEAILYTCSAFGPCIAAVKARLAQLPVLAPNEAMVEEASARVAGQPGATIGLVASFAPTLVSMPAEFAPGTPLRCALAEGALAALQRGDLEAHDAAAARAAQALAQAGCTFIALAQFSLARALPRVAQATGLPVLSTPGSALRRLRERLCV